MSGNHHGSPMPMPTNALANDTEMTAYAKGLLFYCGDLELIEFDAKGNKGLNSTIFAHAVFMAIAAWFLFPKGVWDHGGYHKTIQAGGCVCVLMGILVLFMGGHGVHAKGWHEIFGWILIMGVIFQACAGVIAKSGVEILQTIHRRTGVPLVCCMMLNAYLGVLHGTGVFVPDRPWPYGFHNRYNQAIGHSLPAAGFMIWAYFLYKADANAPLTNMKVEGAVCAVMGLGYILGDVVLLPMMAGKAAEWGDSFQQHVSLAAMIGCFGLCSLNLARRGFVTNMPMAIVVGAYGLAMLVHAEHQPSPLASTLHLVHAYLALISALLRYFGKTKECAIIIFAGAIVFIASQEAVTFTFDCLGVEGGAISAIVMAFCGLVVAVHWNGDSVSDVVEYGKLDSKTNASHLELDALNEDDGVPLQSMYAI